MRTLLRTAPVATVLALGLGVAGLAGTSGAVAATMITGKQIKDGSVTGADLRDGSLTGSDVKNGSLGTSDTSVDLDRYEQRIGSFTSVAETSPAIGAGAGASVTATCPEGLGLLGAFAWWKNQNTGTQVEYHAPDGAAPYAVAYSDNANSSSDTLLLTITCGATTS